MDIQDKHGSEEPLVKKVESGRPFNNHQLLEEVERCVEVLAVLGEIGQAIGSALHLDHLLQAIYEQTGRLMDTTSLYVALYDEERDTISFPFVVEGGQRVEWPSYRAGKGLLEYAIRTKKPLLLARDIADWVERKRDLESPAGWPKSWLGVPLILGEKVLGVIGMQDYEIEGAYGVGHLHFLSATASQAAFAIANARLYESARRRTEELTTLNDISRAVTSTLDLDEVLRLVMQKINESFEVEAGSLLLLDEEMNELVFKVTLEGGAEKLAGFRVKVGQGIAGWVVQTGKPALVLDPQRDPRWYSEISEALNFPTKSILCVPLTVKYKVIGAIELLNKLDGEFNEGDVERLSTMAASIAIGIENARLYEELQQANEGLKELNEAKSEFVSIVAHELRTPMTSIKGYTDILLSGTVGKLTNRQEQFLEIVQVNANRLGKLVSDLLDISRIEAGKVKLDMRPLRVEEIIAEVTSIMASQIETKGLQLETKLAGELPLVQGDHDRILQVLTNLVGNAYNYTPSGGRITVFARLVDARLQISVADTGIGISSKDQERLFERFFRADHPVVREQAGTGLGLSIAKSIIELHGGGIWVESELDQGSTFTFTLPASEAGKDD